MNLVKIIFKVARERGNLDNGPNIVECTIYRDREYAKKIVMCSDDYNDYDEDTYNRFCRQVPGIVDSIYGLDCSPDWFFDCGPKMEEN